jgi:ADP-ribosyl-[dinitrogen reductase] hydrolase
MGATENMGWAKIAWSYGMNVLYRISNGHYHSFSYYEEIKKVLGRGGDSDTNAAIVGGLLGALFGFKQLPTRYLRTIFQLEFP